MKRTLILLYLWLCPAALIYADVKTESRHFLTTEAGVGYSALLNHSNLGKSSGLAGGKLQVGYEWNYRRLIVHTGLEFASVNDKATVLPFERQTPYTIGLPAGTSMVQHFDFQSYSETQYMGQLNIPVQVGGVFADRYYFLAGARLGLPVLHGSATTAEVRTWLTDPTLIGELEEVPVHDAFTSVEKVSHNWAATTLNAQLSAEVGLVLNSFFEKPQKGKGKAKGRSSANRGQGKKNEKKPILYRVGVFFDYGLNSCTAKAAAPVDLVSVSEPRAIVMNDYFQASQTAAHSLLVGAKFAVLFQLNEQKPSKKAKPLPSYFDIYIADAATSKPVAAHLEIYEKTKNKTVTRDVANGHLKYRVKDGEYTITASNPNYYSATQDADIYGEGVTEPVRFALKQLPPPEPEPVSETFDVHIEVGRKVVLHNLLFATNKTVILPESEQALNELYTFLHDNPSLTIRITGHTDDVGSERSNQILSEGRAEAVRNEIVKRGIDPGRIEAEGKGETEPIADNQTEEGRAKNRRVEITITSTGGALIEQVKE